MGNIQHCVWSAASLASVACLPDESETPSSPVGAIELAVPGRIGIGLSYWYTTPKGLDVPSRRRTPITVDNFNIQFGSTATYKWQFNKAIEQKWWDSIISGGWDAVKAYLTRRTTTNT